MAILLEPSGAVWKLAGNLSGHFGDLRHMVAMFCYKSFLLQAASSVSLPACGRPLHSTTRIKPHSRTFSFPVALSWALGRSTFSENLPEQQKLKAKMTHWIKPK